MKKIVYSFLLILSVISLSCCDSTFTKKEIKGLSDPNNYKEYTVVFYEANEINNSSSINNKSTQLNITFTNINDLNLFMTNPISQGSDLNAYIITFFIHEKNNKELIRTNFYQDIQVGDTFTVRVSNFKNANGTKYYWVSEVTFNGIAYLSFNVGMTNIKDFLKEHESPWFNSGK